MGPRSLSFPCAAQCSRALTGSKPTPMAIPDPRSGVHRIYPHKALGQRPPCGCECPAPWLLSALSVCLEESDFEGSLTHSFHSQGLLWLSSCYPKPVPSCTPSCMSIVWHSPSPPTLPSSACLELPLSPVSTMVSSTNQHCTKISSLSSNPG